MSAQDSGRTKDTVKVPGGLACSEFKGYEAWQTISISRNEKVVVVILGNPVMIDSRMRTRGLRRSLQMHPDDTLLPGAD
jgi:hypothetical protein